jgi:hypothetical protein
VVGVEDEDQVALGPWQRRVEMPALAWELSAWVR